MNEPPEQPATAIPPYSHPTTVVFVDDNDLFLHTLDLRMPAEMAHQCYHNPRHALERVNQPLALRPIPERCFSTPAKSLHWNDTIIRFDLGLIEQEISNMERFRRTSVVIADFAMPAMDGLSLLTSINDPSVKTVLMSGAGDEKLALEAFNEGVIDRYIPKNRSTTLDMVVDYAQELQREYFFDQQRAIQESLSLNPPDLLQDPAVFQHFSALRKRHRFVEHYLVGDPPGFMFVTAKGLVHRLILLSDSEVSQQVAYATFNGAPADVVEALATRTHIGFFSELAENYGDELYPWRDFLYPPIRLDGNRTWWAALISNPPTEIDFRAVESSFDAYLDEIDAAIRR
jgi:CheY-like chemotaxis protein